MIETETMRITVSLPFLWAVVRLGLTSILCITVGSWLGKLTGGLSSKERLQVRIACILLFCAGLLFPAS